MSQEYNDRESWQISEFQMGVPIIGAITLILAYLAKSILSSSSWTFGRAFDLLLILVLLASLVMSWREIRKALKVVDRILSEKQVGVLAAKTVHDLRRSIRYLVTISSSVLTVVVIAFWILGRF